MASVKLILQNPYTMKNRGKLLSDQVSGNNPSEIISEVTNKKKKLSLFPKRLYCFLIIDRKHMIKIKTEHTIIPSEWDFIKQYKKEKLAGSLEFNKGLLALKADLLNQYNSLRKDHPELTFEEISIMMKEFGKNRELPMFEKKSFIEALDEYIKVMEGQVTEGTIKKYNTLKRSLMDFGTKNKKYRNLNFRMIDLSFRDTYTDYLRNREPKGRQKRRPEGMQEGLLVDTTGKYIETLKTFCRWAEGRGYNKHTEYQKIQNVTQAEKKLMKAKNDIVTLTLQELKQFYSHDFSDNQSLERVRDLFCFAAFTGQRWSDIEQFSKSQIRGDVWYFKAQKTKKETEIDMIGFAAPALSIAIKYNFQLPAISLQKFNEMLKEAGRLAKIDTPTRVVRYVGIKEIEMVRPKCEFLSSHTARKTCVSILLNVYNLPITHVLEITGHSELKTLQKYIDKDRDARRKALSSTKSITEVMTVKRSNAI